MLLAVPDVDPSCRNNYAIRYASKHGHADVVERLLQDVRVNPWDSDNFSLLAALNHGHLSVIKILLRSATSEEMNYAIKMAVMNGNVDVVTFLMKDMRVDPSTMNNEALRVAAKEKHLGTVEVLLYDHRVEPNAAGDFLFSVFSSAVMRQDIRLVNKFIEDTRINPNVIIGAPALPLKPENALIWNIIENY